MSRRVNVASLLASFAVGYALGYRRSRRPITVTHDADPYDGDDDVDDVDVVDEQVNRSHGYVPGLPRDVER